MSDARERWRAQHRRARIREQRLAPIRRVAAPLCLVMAVGFGVLGLVIEWGWATPAFPLFYLGLRLYGVRPSKDGGAGGSTDGYVG